MVALRKQSAISAIEVPSRHHDGVTHKLYFYNGALKGCSCNWRKFHPRQDCPHMTQYKDERRTAYNYYEMSLGVI